jgi:hypothetical protein
MRLTHELGLVGRFPALESIGFVTNSTDQVRCVADDTIANDWRVSITNAGTATWKDLFFVADPGVAVGNADGTITSGGLTHNAFRIDNIGVNRNLLSESIKADLLFEPGETWIFLVTNFGLPVGVPPFFGSLGIGTDTINPNDPNSFTNSSASILANLDEPSIAGLLGLGLAVIGFSTRGRSRR